MDNGNYVGGSGNGGFHCYRGSPQPTPARSPSPGTKMSMGLPAHLNQAVVECIIQGHDRVMPNLVEIMSRTLPPHAKISDEAKQFMQHFVSEFLCFVTCEAYAHCQREERSTLTFGDVFWVMSKFGFDDYIEPLTLCLTRYREDDGGERESLRRESLLKRPMVDGSSGSNITPYLPPNFPMAHHHFVYQLEMGNGDMQGGASSGSTSQCAVDSDDVESPAKKGKE